MYPFIHENIFNEIVVNFNDWHVCINSVYVFYFNIFNSLNSIINTDIQINNVEPVMDDRKEHLLRKPISQQILRHYRLTITI